RGPPIQMLSISCYLGDESVKGGVWSGKKMSERDECHFCIAITISKPLSLLETRAARQMPFKGSVKIASADLAPARVTVPSRTLGAAARELSAFGSLVTGFRETPTAHATVSKAAKNDKKEEMSALLLPGRLLPEMMAFFTKPAAALELPALDAGLPVTRD